MTKSDILLKDDRITVVGSGDNPKPGLEVSTDESADSDIQLNPEWANIAAGGGGGKSSEGDLFLIDKASKPRIHLSAQSGNRGGSEEAPWGGGNPNVWIDGEKGAIDLVGEESGGDFVLRQFGRRLPRVQITAKNGTNRKVDPESNRVWIDGQNGILQMGAESTKWEQQDIKLDSQKANLKLGGGLREIDTIGSASEEERITKGRSEGDIKLLDEPGNTRVQITAARHKSDETPSVLVSGGVSDDKETGRVELYDHDKSNPSPGGPYVTLDGRGSLELKRFYQVGTEYGRSDRVGTSVDLDGRKGKITAGGAKSDGVVTVQDTEETKNVELGVGEQNGGLVSVYSPENSKTAELRGTDAELKLGNSYSYTVDNSEGIAGVSGGRVVSGGTSGKLLLDDGSPPPATMTATIEAKNGKIDIGTTRGTEPLLRIDTQQEKILTKWPVERM